jgi:RsiW-degrading membrane proteinase PrsW (M82 family)
MNLSLFFGDALYIIHKFYLSALLLHINFNYAKSHSSVRAICLKRGTKVFLHVLIYRWLCLLRVGFLCRFCRFGG